MQEWLKPQPEEGGEREEKGVPYGMFTNLFDTLSPSPADIIPTVCVLGALAATKLGLSNKKHQLILFLLPKISHSLMFFGATVLRKVQDI